VENWGTLWSSEQHSVIESCIERWQERMRQSREWVCFADLADWCARESGTINPDERKKVNAYRQLGESLKLGKFGTGKHTRVPFPDGLILKGTKRWIRMTTQTYEQISEEGRGWEAVLEGCWIPRDLARQWLEAKRLALPPWLSSPESEAIQNAPRCGKINETPAPQPLSRSSPTPPPAADMRCVPYNIERASLTTIGWLEPETPTNLMKPVNAGQ
jgi:hypothetical protein